MNIVSVFICLIICQISLGQNSHNTKSENDSIFSITNLELKPEFPTGESKFFDFIFKNFKAPETFSGKIFINFIVEKDGTLTNIEVKNGNAQLNAEAIRVLSLSPKWNPGKRLDKIVRVKYSLPMDFKSGN